MASLATVYPDWVGIGHLELRLLERSIGIGVWYGDAERRDQTRGRDKNGKETHKPESKPPGAGEQGLAKVDCVAV